MKRFNKLRQPCDRFNAVFYPYSGTATNCASPCYSAPCHYIVQLECSHWVEIPTSGLQELIAVPCMVLKKDCVQGNTWTSRWAKGGSSAGFEDDRPALKIWSIGDTPNCGIINEIPQCGDCAEPGSSGWNDYIAGLLAQVTNCCHWGDESLYWDGLRSCDPVPAGVGCFDGSATLGNGPSTAAFPACWDVDESCFQKWKLTVASESTAVLRLVTRTGYTCIYGCDDWACDTGGTFTMTTRAPEVFGLPTCICVRAVTTSQDDTQCADGTQECVGCLDFGCGLPFCYTICGGDPTVLDMVWCRDYGDCDLGEIPEPESDCGYFAQTVECPTTGTGLTFIAFHVGGTWDVQVWCCTSEVGSCHQLPSEVTSQSCECGGIYFTYTYELDEYCPCCAGCTNCDCVGLSNVPASINVAVTTSCASAGTGSGTLTQVGESCVYSGSFAMSGGGTITVQLALDVCTVAYTHADICSSGNDATGGCDITNLTCDPVDGEVTCSEYGANDCGGCTANETITFTFSE